MKKFIVVIMALITVFSASVVSFGYNILEGAINGSNLDLITNQSFGSRNCTLVYYNSTSPDVTDTDSLGNPLFQKASYSALSALYDNITVNGVSLAQNFVRDRTYQWYVAGGHCFILINGDRNGVFIQNQLWAGNADGKILYCDAPEDETAYDVVAIAGTTTYFLTDRPINTITSGYLGDLKVSYSNWSNILSTLNQLSGSTNYYAYVSSVDGEYRYYMLTLIGGEKYLVCNSAGQLYYAIKDEVVEDEDTGGGSTFDPTEVITAINSVYDAINDAGSNIATRITNLRTSVDSISEQFGLHMNNTVNGFDGINSQLTTLNSYFSELSGLFPVQETLTLSGSDARVAWDSADRITDVSLSGFGDGDLTVKQYPGALIDESGYEKVELSPDTTEYTLSTVDDYRRVTANIEYPDSGAAIPDGTLFYCSFDDDSVSSSVGDLEFSVSGGGASYASGLSGNAFVFSGSNYIYSTTSSFPTLNQPFTLSFWVYVSEIPPNGMIAYHVGGYDMGLDVSIRYRGGLGYTISSDRTTYMGSTNINVNSWNNIALTFDGSTGYGFVNGVLDVSFSASGLASSNSYFYIGNSLTYFPSGSMIDEVIFVNGSALWTSSFDADNEAIFSAVAADYFLPCTDQTIGLVFDDTLSKTLTPTDVNGNSITMGRLEDDFSRIYMDISTMMWYCHDPQTQTEILLSSANQQIMNDTIYIRQNYVSYAPDQVTANTLQSAFPVDAPVYVDMPESAKVTITYDHYSGWFRMMYLLMDKQTQLLTELDIVNETIVDIDNTVIEISPDNDAFNIFYIEKTDGSKESVGDAAKDAAVFVGDILSMFYRLVFDDALDNAEVIQDFEDVLTTTNTGVNVW